MLDTIGLNVDIIIVDAELIQTVTFSLPEIERRHSNNDVMRH
jgi:hypothetical protein